jgi:hypothetical protein
MGSSGGRARIQYCVYQKHGHGVGVAKSGVLPFRVFLSASATGGWGTVVGG